MLVRVLVLLFVLLTLVKGLAGNMMNDGGAIMLLLVILGIVYGFVGIDAENPTAYLAVVIATGAAAGADVLSHLPAIGGYMDAMLGAAAVALYASVPSVLLMRVVNRIKG